jgi:hypothetical protein
LKIVLRWAKIILIGPTSCSSFIYFFVLFLLVLFIKIYLISKLCCLSKLITICSLNGSKSWFTWFLLWNCVAYQFYIDIFLFFNLLFLCKASAIYWRNMLFLIFIRIDTIAYILLVIWPSSRSKGCIILFCIHKIGVF